MGKPAARIGDMHTCPLVSPGGVPHGGGPITEPGSISVFIEGKPAATAGDACFCNGAQDKIVSGSTGVFIEGKPAARHGDKCAHGGIVMGGSGTVEIGESMGSLIFSNPKKVKKEKYVEPSQEEKESMINEAIRECIGLLGRKLDLLECKDPTTMGEFKKWFGCDDEEAFEKILHRTRKALKVAQGVSLNNFDVIKDEFKRRRSFAIVYSDDISRTFYLGNLFWKKDVAGGRSRGSVLVHELSHFDDIGKTADYDYGVEQCLYLSEYYPKQALDNADNFEHFIIA